MYQSCPSPCDIRLAYGIVGFCDAAGRAHPLPSSACIYYAPLCQKDSGLCRTLYGCGLSWAIWGEHIDTACLCNGGRYVGRSFV